METGTSLLKVSQMVGCDYKSANQWAAGHCLPHLVYAFKLDAVTKGGVPPASWLGTELGRMAWQNMRGDQDNWKELKEQERKRRTTRKRLAASAAVSEVPDTNSSGSTPGASDSAPGGAVDAETGET